MGAVFNERDDKEVGRGRGGQRGGEGEVRGGGSYENKKNVTQRKGGSKEEEGSLKLHSAGLIPSTHGRIRRGTVHCREVSEF